MNARVALSFRDDGASIALAELSALAAKAPLEVGQRLVDLAEAGEKLGLVEFDSLAATAAGEIVVRAYPSDLLLRLVAAARTGKLDLGSIEDALGHVSNPSPAIANAREGSPFRREAERATDREAAE